MRYITKHSLPTEPCACIMKSCIYLKEGGGICQDPRNNRGNSDAFCHTYRPRMVMNWIKLECAAHSQTKEKS